MGYCAVSEEYKISEDLQSPYRAQKQSHPVVWDKVIFLLGQ